jgi:drug/metabolite transporter (DMT)-like permease
MSPFKRFTYIIALTMMWSPSFLFIKLAVQDLPPITIAASRVSMGALVFLIILWWTKTSFPKNRIFWIHSIMMGLFSSVFPFCLFCFAEKTIDSSLAAIINGASPMFTSTMSHFFITTDRIQLHKGIGIGLSAAGLLLLFAPNIQAEFSGSSLGMLAATGAAFSYAVGHVYGKKFATGQKPFVAPAASLLTSALILLPLSLTIEKSYALPMPSITAMGGVLGLTLFGTILAFIIYYKLLEHSGPTAISTVACFFPVGGMLLGFIFLGESLTFQGLIAASTIFIGLLTVNEIIKFKIFKPIPTSDFTLS